MRKQKLTRPEAWREIKRRFQDGSPYYGLCYEIRRLWEMNRITNGVYIRLACDIESVRPSGGGFFWPTGHFGNTCRIKAIDRILKKITK